ncbi:kinase-like domain-containing protein [Schizophyllum amplum]|uniref:mitogen-activated protein kinase n=1 Tax=Schizophyllum amplum TaxID=97359 RepID=A0A550C7Q3_9AGAR|nr:kinase-like domain-containing protein [Auriculariopsis ampla]
MTVRKEGTQQPTPSDTPQRPGSRGRAKVPGEEEEKSGSSMPSGGWPDRGRSRVRRPSNPFSEDNLRRRGYHSLMSSFGKVFHVERRWKLVREMGSGAYGVVISAADEISGETVAIKMVTRVFEKIQLAKRALREITLLRHFAGHENITGLIDVDAITPDFNEIYIFMEPMEADLHQIIKSGQTLTNEHVQYFLYQVLRGMKYIHSASVIHRDLKPGNLLVNADCELKICDFGLSRGYESKPDENASHHLTEYVATRWYRAPEIMLAFRYDNDCVHLGFSVDQLNKILDVLGSPHEFVISRIGSDKAQAYVRSLPHKPIVPFSKVIPSADSQAVDLLTKMLAFDPSDRITVKEALAHPYLASYHDITDEPECSRVFDRWREVEELETIDDFREALWNEVEDYRREVRGMPRHDPLSGVPLRRSLSRTVSSSRSVYEDAEEILVPEVVKEEVFVDERTAPSSPQPLETVERTVSEEPDSQATVTTEIAEEPSPIPQPPSQLPPQPPMPDAASLLRDAANLAPGIVARRRTRSATTDPLVSYARRSSILQPRQSSMYGTQFPATIEGLPPVAEPAGIAFPSQQGYVVPARSRTGSTVDGEPYTRKLLRTLSTVSIHERLPAAALAHAQAIQEGKEGEKGEGKSSGEDKEGREESDEAADPKDKLGRYIVEKAVTGADAPASEMPREFDEMEEQFK